MSSVPRSVRFDRYAALTNGLVTLADNLPLEVGIDGMSLLTGWINSISVWEPLYPQPVTVWTLIS